MIVNCLPPHASSLLFSILHATFISHSINFSQFINILNYGVQKYFLPEDFHSLFFFFLLNSNTKKTVLSKDKKKLKYFISDVLQRCKMHT